MWFAASILYERVGTDEALTDELWQESIVLLDALDAEEAADKARDIGSSRSVAYDAVEGGRVRWEFRRVAGVDDILNAMFAHGTEVFSRFISPDLATALMRHGTDQ
jgi:hypothetical protein